MNKPNGNIANFRLVCRGRIVASRAVYPLGRITGMAARAAYMPPLLTNPQIIITVKPRAGRAPPLPRYVFYCPVGRGDPTPPKKPSPFGGRWRGTRRMRGKCPEVAPSSVTCGDSFPQGGSLLCGLPVRTIYRDRLFDSSAAQHKKRTPCRDTARGAFFMELMGVEPMSERKSVRVSPGAACLLNFPWRGRIRTHYALVASLIPDGLPSSGPCMFSTESTP